MVQIYLQNAGELFSFLGKTLDPSLVFGGWALTSWGIRSAPPAWEPRFFRKQGAVTVEGVVMRVMPLGYQATARRFHGQGPGNLIRPVW